MSADTYLRSLNALALTDEQLVHVEWLYQLVGNAVAEMASGGEYDEGEGGDGLVMDAIESTLDLADEELLGDLLDSRLDALVAFLADG